MDQGSLFPSEPKKRKADKADNAAKEAKRKAIEQVRRNANPEFLRMYRKALEAVARDKSRFTTDEIWERYEQYPSRPFQHEPRAASPVVRQAAKDGVIAFVKHEQRPSTSTRCHNRPKQVYQSLIYRGEA